VGIAHFENTRALHCDGPSGVDDEFESHLLGERVAYRVKVVRVETITVESKKRTPGFCQNGQKEIVRLLCQLAEAARSRDGRRDRFGRRRILVAGLGLFVAASAGCALAGSAG
jgi:hypothetical protein